MTALCPPRPRSRRATCVRLVSVFRRGWITLIMALIRQEPLPQGRFVPEPWPRAPETEEEEVSKAAEAMPQAA